MTDTEWEYDTVSFIGQIRKSGGSLVITIPTELKNRFLISEGQRVRIIGLTRRRPYIEGGLLIYLGRFQVTEEVYGVSIIVDTSKLKNLDMFKEDIYRYLSEEVRATDIVIDEEEGKMVIEAYFGQIAEREIISREKDFLKEVIRRIKEIVKENNGEVIEVKTFKESRRWSSIDPSVIKRYTFSIPETINYRWLIQ